MSMEGLFFNVGSLRDSDHCHHLQMHALASLIWPNIQKGPGAISTRMLTVSVTYVTSGYLVDKMKGHALLQFSCNYVFLVKVLHTP